jgi:hypothetical protein
MVQRKDKFYCGPEKQRKKKVRKKWRCSCGFSTHSDEKMSDHLQKYA